MTTITLTIEVPPGAKLLSVSRVYPNSWKVTFQDEGNFSIYSSIPYGSGTHEDLTEACHLAARSLAADRVHQGERARAAAARRTAPRPRAEDLLKLIGDEP